jgi:hypothetical protein
MIPMELMSFSLRDFLLLSWTCRDILNDVIERSRDVYSSTNCLEKEQDAVVHNYLLYLYVQGDEGMLASFPLFLFSFFRSFSLLLFWNLTGLLNRRPVVELSEAKGLLLRLAVCAAIVHRA